MINPEAAARVLQGQVPASLRAIGFKGFNCNLELVGQVRGDGANWQSDEFREQRDEFRGYQIDELMEIESITLAPTMAPPMRRRLVRRLAARKSAFQSST